MTEQSDVTSPALKALATLPGVWAMRVHSGRARGGRQHLAPDGTPDVFCIVRGRPVFFECKDRKGVMRESQLEQMRRIRLSGAEIYVVRSVTEVLHVVRGLLEGEPARKVGT